MAIDAVGVGTEYGGPVLTTTSGATTTGSTFVVLVSWGESRDAPVVTDAYDNAYTLRGGVASGGAGDRSAVWVCENGVGGPDHTATITFDDDPGGGAAHFIEITGAAAASLDAYPTPAFDTASPFTLASGTLAQANEVLLSLCASDSGSNPATHACAGWTNISTLDNLASFWGSVVAKLVVSDAASKTASWTVGGATNAKVHVLSFREASAPPPASFSGLMLMGVGGGGFAPPGPPEFPVVYIDTLQSDFDAAYAANLSSINALTTDPSGPYELAYVHFALHEMWRALEDRSLDGSAYMLESLRLYEAEMANYSNWDAGRQPRLHFAVEAQRLVRLGLPGASGGVKTRIEALRDNMIAANFVTTSHLIAANDEITTSTDVVGTQALMEITVGRDRGFTEVNPAFASYLSRIEDFGDGAAIWDQGKDMPWSDPATGTGPDVSHHWRTILFFRTAFEHGLSGYDATLMTKIARLLGYTIWNQNVAAPRYTNYIDGGNVTFESHAPWTWGNILGGWPWLAQFDPQAAIALKALYDVRKTGGLPSGNIPGSPAIWSDQPVADICIPASLIRLPSAVMP